MVEEEMVYEEVEEEKSMGDQEMVVETEVV